MSEENPRWMEIQECRRMEKYYQRAARKAERKSLRDENARIRAELRGMGWDIGVVHVRQYGIGAYDLAATGGLTLAVAERRFVTEAVCHERDHYDKLIGSNLALKRLREAIDQMKTFLIHGTEI